MMGVKTFEEMLEEFKGTFKNALIADAGEIGSAMNVAKTGLELCTNLFEEQTFVENLKEVFEETMEELKES